MVHLPLIAHAKPYDKKWSSSQSLNYYVAVGAQFPKTKDPVLKFCNNCTASRSSKEGPMDNK